MVPDELRETCYQCAALSNGGSIRITDTKYFSNNFKMLIDLPNCSLPIQSCLVENECHIQTESERHDIR